MKGKVGLYGVVSVLGIAAVLLVAENTDVRPQQRRDRDATKTQEAPKGEPTQAVRQEPNEEPAGRPARVGRDVGEQNPRTTPTPLPNEAPNLVQPGPQPPVPAQDYRNNEGTTYEGRGNYGGYGRDEGGDFGDGGRGSYERTYHGEHDRWRYDRFRGSWDFLIFPGAVTYAPQPYYGAAVSRRVAGVHVEYSGDDATGSGFAGAVEDQLRENEMGPVPSAADASLELYIISMDEEPTNPGYSSAVSVSYILMPEYRFITAQLLDVGAEQADALAASCVSYAQQLLDENR